MTYWGILAIPIAWLFGWVIARMIWQFLGRWRYIGRKGYGYELRGLERLRVAFQHWRDYDLEDWLP